MILSISKYSKLLFYYFKNTCFDRVFKARSQKHKNFQLLLFHIFAFTQNYILHMFLYPAKLVEQ